jgi:hypothetical protein
MLAELGNALERSADLNAIAISLWEGPPPEALTVALTAALKENRDAMMRASLELAAAWEEGYAARDALGRGQSPEPPERRLRLVKAG